MKTIIILLFCFFIFQFSYGQTNCTTPPCYGTSCDCTSWSDWASRIENIVLPEFPLCTLQVEYCYRQCLTDYTCVEIFINWMQIKPPFCGTGCDEFTTYIMGSVNHAYHIKHEIIKIISYRNFESFINSIPEDAWPKCSSGNIRHKYSYFETVCAITCFTQHPISDPTVDLLITFRNCTEEFCCKITNSFCVNNDGTIHQEETRTSTTPMNCLTIPPPVNNCPPGQNVSSTECVNPCEIF